VGITARPPLGQPAMKRIWGMWSFRKDWSAGQLTSVPGSSASPQQGKGVRDGGAFLLQGPNLLTVKILGQLDPNWEPSFLFRLESFE
jgi:hypothetical protein